MLVDVGAVHGDHDRHAEVGGEALRQRAVRQRLVRVDEVVAGRPYRRQPADAAVGEVAEAVEEEAPRRLQDARVLGDDAVADRFARLAAAPPLALAAPEGTRRPRRRGQHARLDAELLERQDLLVDEEVAFGLGPRIEVRHDEDLEEPPLDHAGARVGAILSSVHAPHLTRSGRPARRLCARAMLEDTARGDGLLDEQSGRGRSPRVRTVSRTYQPGDEAQINRLYLSLTGRDRTPEEFAWEWLDTWAGQGSMNLVFDLDREEGDQLVAQYSLIPTPLSVWGRPALAGKTENCMSHPDHRGTGLYSAHERECFEREKERYSFFFTTAGTVSAGAVGRVRSKLGYVAFDDWANYTLWLKTSVLREDIGSILRAKGAKKLAPALSSLLAGALQAYSHVRRVRSCRYRVAVHDPADAPLEAIADLWERNRRRYGITVDRSAGVPAVAGERRPPRGAQVPDHAR